MQKEISSGTANVLAKFQQYNVKLKNNVFVLKSYGVESGVSAIPVARFMEFKEHASLVIATMLCDFEMYSYTRTYIMYRKVKFEKK